MLQSLAGKLTWEPDGDGIRVYIPAKRSWVLLFFGVWLTGWTFAGLQVMRSTFHATASHSINWFNLLWLVGWAFGECAVVYSIIWAIGGLTTLTLHYSDLSVSRNLFGFRLNGFTCPTSEVRNLRYAPMGRARNSAQSQIKFEKGGKTCSFASGISDVEAFALIDKMLVVYPFPKDRALEYIDLSR